MSGTRDVSFILRKVRDVLLKRKHVNTLRFQDEMSPKTQPQPNLPEGTNQKLSANYYFTRDTRRQVNCPEVIFEGNTMLKLPDKNTEKPSAIQRIPGKVHLWDS